MIEIIKQAAEKAEQQRLRTLDHRERVAHLIRIFCNEMLKRAIEHDRSKFEEPEFSEFARYVPELQELSYPSDEYKHNLNKLKDPALDNHYANNDHHPEHHAEGVEDMDLFQFCEMVMDWFGASERHEDGDPIESINHHVKEGTISKEVGSILKNTVASLRDMGAID